jgi:GT2 family glycosyltransferase
VVPNLSGDIESVERPEQGNGANSPKVVIVVVHTRNFDNTVECAESIFLSDYANSTLVICDNSSDVSLSDHLVERIKAVTNYSIKVLTKADLTQLGDVSIDGISIIRCGQNLGYAAAANLGFILALKDRLTKYVWLLNDDVVVEPSCLKRMICRVRGSTKRGNLWLSLCLLSRFG